MRIWDVDPGYLNRQSLLGEHRELHGMVNVIVHGKKGYANHPETLRWASYGWALSKRHAQLSAEMTLRGYKDRTPADLTANEGVWPEDFIDAPAEQFHILTQKYVDKPGGRIPFPRSSHALWAQHKYSVMARGYEHYKEYGARVAALCATEEFDILATEFVTWLRTPPSEAGMRTALEHMWGYVSDVSELSGSDFSAMNALEQLVAIRDAAVKNEEPYLLHSTALGELGAWLQSRVNNC